MGAVCHFPPSPLACALSSRRFTTSPSITSARGCGRCSSGTPHQTADEIVIIHPRGLTEVLNQRLVDVCVGILLFIARREGAQAQAMPVNPSWRDGDITVLPTTEMA